MVEYIKQGVEDITDADQVADFLKKILKKEAGDGPGLIYAWVTRSTLPIPAPLF